MNESNAGSDSDSNYAGSEVTSPSEQAFARQPPRAVAGKAQGGMGLDMRWGVSLAIARTEEKGLRTGGERGEGRGEQYYINTTWLRSYMDGD